MKKIKSLVSFIDAMNEYTGKFFGIMLILMIVGMIVVEVVRRYAFDNPIMGIQDVQCAYFGIYYMMGAAYCHLLGGHVKVDVLHARQSLRTQAILDLITYPVVLLFIGALIWTGWRFAMDATWTVGVGWILEVDQSHLRLPLYLTKWSIPLGTFLLFLQSMAKFVRDLYFVVNRKELA
ncbi:MAG TPA: TRAP transporter small permease subunit [Dehalococcoidia bacterium]|nr:TRAP transporter small permease subunit [Dehalococcoidia bacterium]